MDGYLGRRGISLLRLVLLAVFGVFAWLVWFAGPSQAADLLPPGPSVPSVPPVPLVPSVPSVPLVLPLPSVLPSPRASIAPDPLPDPLRSLVGGIPPAIPSPSQLAEVPETLVNQLPNGAAPPALVGMIDAVTAPVDSTIEDLPTLPMPSLLPVPPTVPALPPAPKLLPPSGTSVPAVLTVEVPAWRPATASTSPDPAAVLRAGALSPAARTVPSAIGSVLRFIPDNQTPVFPVELAMTNSWVVGVPPADTPALAAASPHESGSTPTPHGGSADGSADLPEQRALLPPFHDGRVPKDRQSPTAEPAFDPGSSPD